MGTQIRTANKTKVGSQSDQFTSRSQQVDFVQNDWFLSSTLKIEALSKVIQNSSVFFWTVITCWEIHIFMWYFPNCANCTSRMSSGLVDLFSDRHYTSCSRMLIIVTAEHYLHCKRHNSRARQVNAYHHTRAGMQWLVCATDECQRTRSIEDNRLYSFIFLGAMYKFQLHS